METNELSRELTVDEEQFDRAMDRMDEELAKMGYSSFRDGQREPIINVMLGKDTICILPTGTGKTLCMALPTVCCGHKTVVFSPLVALMTDQVNSMNRKGIRSASLSSNNTDAENMMAIQEWIRGDLSVLYVAPERIGNEQFEQAMDLLSPSFIALDESHAISQFSATFRPAYNRVGDFILKHKPKTVLAMTATATKEIIDDVRRIAHIENAVLCRTYKPRTNLHLSSSRVSDDKLLDAVLEKVRAVKGKVIVYCSTVDKLGEIVMYLEQMGESVTLYHGQLAPSQKDCRMADFVEGRCRVMVATNAFGMGIDIPDIEAIIHANIPGSVEAISQETGRAARDGRDAYCHMFLTPYGENIQFYFHKMSNPTGTEVAALYRYLTEKADASGEVQMTMKDIVAGLGGGVGFEGALNYLVTLGCVDRIKSQNKISRIIVQSTPEDIESDAMREALACVLDHGFESGVSEKGNKIYDIDLAYMGEKLGKSESVVKRRISDMKKAHYIDVVPPFRGKVTKLIHPPTHEDRRAAEKRREAEANKLMQVIRYCDTPDDKKQDFLVNYFNIDA